MTPGELEHLLPLAIDALKLEAGRDWLGQHNPTKRDEFIAMRRRYAESRLERVNVLFKAWIELQVDRCAS